MNDDDNLATSTTKMLIPLRQVPLSSICMVLKVMAPHTSSTLDPDPTVLSAVVELGWQVDNARGPAVQHSRCRS